MKVELLKKLVEGIGIYTELDFKKCFEERTKYYMKQNGDPLLDVMLDCSQDSLFIVPNHVLWDESF